MRSINPKSAWVEEIVLNYKILVDTSALMQRNSDRFFLEILLPFLKKHNKKVIIPKVVKKEIAKHLNNPENSPSAERAERILQVYRKEGLLVVGYDEGDVFPDQVFHAILARFKLHTDLAFVTNDNTLIEDLCAIYNSESVKTRRSMVVVKVTGNGYPIKVVNDGEIIRPLRKPSSTPEAQKTPSGGEGG